MVKGELNKDIYAEIERISAEYGLPIPLTKYARKERLLDLRSDLRALKKEGNDSDDDNIVAEDDLDELLKSNEVVDEAETAVEEAEEEAEEAGEEAEAEAEVEAEEEAKEEVKGEAEVGGEGEVETENSKRLLKSVRMEKLIKKQSLMGLKKSMRPIIAQYNRDVNQLKNQLEELDDITTDEVEAVVNYYNDIRTEAENEINLSIDGFEGNIPETFYIWIENLIDKKHKELHKLII